MTEQQIQEMVEEVEREGGAGYKGWWIVFPSGRNAPVEWRAYYDWERRDNHRDIHLTIDGTDRTPTDAIRAAIAMIDRLETALQEDA